MTNRIMALILILLMCITLIAYPVSAEISGYSGATVSISILDSNMNLITGKIARGESFYVKANVSGISNDTIFNVYCAVFDSTGIKEVFKEQNTPGSLEATIDCAISEDIGDDYFLKVFVWEDEDLTPLKDMIAFNASSPYETKLVDGTMFAGRNILKNPSFEDDNNVVNAWDARSHAQVTKTSKKKQDGNYSCLVSDRTKYYDSIIQDITTDLKQSGSGDYLVEYSIYPVFSGFSSQWPDRSFKASLVMCDENGTQTHFTVSPYNKLYLKSVKGRQWNTLSQTAKINLPNKLHKADFYIENTAEASEDFYIDSCALRKLITHEEYLMDNKPVDYHDSDMEEYLEIINFCNDTNTSVVYPQNSDELLKNPYKGLNYYTTKLDLSTLNLNADGAKCANVVYHRLSWSDLEPEEGKYNWDIIDKNIEKLKANNMMLGIGIGSCITYNDYNSSTNAQKTPAWLMNYDIPYTVQEVGNGSVANNKVYNDPKTNKQYIRVPVYNNPIFKEKMQNFIQAFADRYNDNPNIAYVDMRVYGNWGEWHFEKFNSTIKNDSYIEDGVTKKYTNDDLNALVAMFRNYRLPLAMFTGKTAQLNYAMNELGAGIRVDGTMHPYKKNEHRKFLTVQDKNFAVAEWFFQPEEYLSTGKYSAFEPYMPVYLEKTIKEGKVSYTSLGYWNPERFYTNYPDLVHRIANKVGYWFKASKIMYPQNLTSGIFAMTIKNDGVTKLYPGFKKNACVKLALADQSGKIIDTIKLPGVDPAQWQEGKFSYIANKYSFSKTAGATKLYFGVFSDADKTNPDIKLGINATPINGWYDVATIASNTYKSDNKLYTASYPYADNGYGYREPYYAFDGDDSTFWASEVKKDEYLEINFGEYVDISSMMLNCNEATNARYSVKGYDGKTWVTLYSSSSFSAGENLLNFDETRVSKVRIVFDETSEQIVKVNEMFID